MQRQFVSSMVLVAALGLATSAQAQGVVGGAAHGSAVGNQAAGPVGAVVGGVVGGVLGGVGAVLGVDYHPDTWRSLFLPHRCIAIALTTGTSVRGITTADIGQSAEQPRRSQLRLAPGRIRNN